jgi:hypothetical protein
MDYAEGREANSFDRDETVSRQAGQSQEIRATQAFVRSRIIRLVDFTRPDEGGTAVKVRLGDRFFLATAAHVIPRSRDIRALIPGEAGTFVSGFANRLVDLDHDLGLLEVSVQDAKSMGGTFVTSDEIDSKFNHDVTPIVVAGYPGQLIYSADREILACAIERVHHFRSLTFYTETLPTSEWPDGLEQSPTVFTDLFASFTPNLSLQKIQMDNLAEPAEEVRLEELHLGGMSGGGVWLELSRRTEGVWRPDVRLIALDRSFKMSDGWLRASLIAPWLRMVRENYPDLDAVIREILG